MQIGFSLRLINKGLIDWVCFLLQLMLEKVSFSFAVLVRVVWIASSVLNGRVTFWDIFRFFIGQHKRGMRLQNIVIIYLTYLLVLWVFWLAPYLNRMNIFGRIHVLRDDSKANKIKIQEENKWVGKSLILITLLRSKRNS